MTLNLVTGGSGYFGSLLAHALVARGEQVRVLDLVEDRQRDPRIEFIGGDVRDRGVVAESVTGVDRVFNNVAQVPLARDNRLLTSVNVGGTANILNACREFGVSKVVHTSSSAVFGVPRSNPVMPDTTPRPMEAYGKAKLAAEELCRSAVARGQNVSVLRPRTIVGHGRLGIFGILFDWISSGVDPIVLGDGSNRYQFIHGDDLVSATIAAADRDAPGVYNVGAPDVQTMAETLSHLCEFAGTGAEVRRLPARPAIAAMKATARLGLTPFAPYHWLMYASSMWFDNQPACDQLGWQPSISTDAMFAESYTSFIDNRAAHAREVSNGDPTSDPAIGTQDALGHHRSTTSQGILAIARHMTRFLPAVN